MKLSLISLFFAVASLCPAEDPEAAAKKDLPKEAPPEMTGLEVGTKAPNFSLKDQDGNEVSLKELLETGTTAVVFHRSADW